MTSVDKQLHDAHSSILIMTSVEKYDFSRHTNMTPLYTQTTFFIYIDLVILYIVVVLLQQKGTYSLAQINNNAILIYKASISFNLLSLAGLPPFLGFFIKWISLEMNILPPLFVLTLVTSPCLSVYFYFKIAISLLLFPSEIKSKRIENLAVLSIGFNIFLPLFFF